MTISRKKTTDTEIEKRIHVFEADADHKTASNSVYMFVKLQFGY